MKLKITWLLTLIMALTVQFAFAQEKTVNDVKNNVENTLNTATEVISFTKIEDSICFVCIQPSCCGATP